MLKLQNYEPSLPITNSPMASRMRCDIFARNSFFCESRVLRSIRYSRAIEKATRLYEQIPENFIALFLVYIRANAGTEVISNTQIGERSERVRTETPSSEPYCFYAGSAKIKNKRGSLEPPASSVTRIKIIKIRNRFAYISSLLY